MYQKIANGWLKHLDFMVLDCLIFQIAYVISYLLRNRGGNPYADKVYLSGALVLILIHICAAFFMESYRGILSRGRWQEFKASLKQTVIVVMGLVFFLFLTQTSSRFSRSMFFCLAVLSLFLIYAERLAWKRWLLHHTKETYRKRGMVVVTTAEKARSVLRTIQEKAHREVELIGVVLADGSASGSDRICGVPVVSSLEDLTSYVQKRWVDEILFRMDKSHPVPEGLLKALESMGITTHICLAEASAQIPTQTVEKVAGYLVLTNSIRIATPRQIFLKRGMDILGAVVGLVFTGILTILIAPAIYAASPGPIFFSQKRVGKNGRMFKIYKFRSMYMDAEERKKELMEKNQMKGFMFKMDADPRIIGSGKDGTRHGLGWFIRKTSIDEFPQFLNVLRGDMSLVGTRPPTVDEWQQYELHHRARMAVKPGLTGLWQVSGRSDITDFEDVVKLDMQYIQNWNLGEDIRILFKTVAVVLKGSGSK